MYKILNIYSIKKKQQNLQIVQGTNLHNLHLSACKKFHY